MALRERSATDRVLAARERYVAAGISTPPLVVERAEGARLWDADGREYIDFAGGLGCRDPRLGDALGGRRRPGLGRLRRARARAGGGGFHPDARRFPRPSQGGV